MVVLFKLLKIKMFEKYKKKNKIFHSISTEFE